MVPCRVLHRAVVFRGVVSLSSVDYVYVLAGAQGEHKVGRASWEGEAINNQYTQLGTCILGPILSAAHTRSPISIVSAKCRLQDSCNSARCAQHAHAHTTPRVSTARSRALCSACACTHHPACLNCKMLVCYFGLSNGGLGAILCMHSPRQMRAVWSSRLLRLLAKQQLAAAHAYVCMRWQYSAGNTTLPPQLPRNLYVSIPAQ